MIEYMTPAEIIVFEYANKQNYVKNNIPMSIRLWKKMLDNRHYSLYSKYLARCALITQYRFLVSFVPILKPMMDEYFVKNREYLTKYKAPVYKGFRYDTIKAPITNKDIRRMRVRIILAAFGKDFSKSVLAAVV